VSTLRVSKIPEELKRRFKEICKDQGKTMSEAVLEFIKEMVGEKILRDATDKFKRRHYRR
jgi:predicted DNA-binding protein